MGASVAAVMVGFSSFFVEAEFLASHKLYLVGIEEVSM